MSQCSHEVQFKLRVVWHGCWMCFHYRTVPLHYFGPELLFLEATSCHHYSYSTLPPAPFFGTDGPAWDEGQGDWADLLALLAPQCIENSPQKRPGSPRPKGLWRSWEKSDVSKSRP